MKNIDDIIKYLSGEMLPDKSRKFKKELSENAALRNEFESVSPVWEEIRKQLQLKDGPDSADREQLIAEILAEHDIQFYGTSTETKKETAFREKLSQSMIEAKKTEKPIRRISPRIYSMISLMAAAMVTALVIILNPAPDLNELSEAYYQPVSDPVFERVNATSRSGISSAMALFKQGNFKAALSLASEEMIKYPDVSEIHLLFALASYEAGDFTQAESHLITLLEGDNTEVSESARWYLSLVHIQTSNKEKARPYLEHLNSGESAYQRRANKLLKKMK
jgi:hypothetical protein